MNRLLLPVLLLLIFIFGGWGGTGHKIINRKSVESFPQEMSIFNNWAAQLEAKASDADYRKGDDPDESPKHYIDIDNYSDFVNTGRIPQTWDSVTAIYGYNFVINQGTLPWAILAAVDSIQKAFERDDLETAVLISADLGHYVADAHNPLHITKNYNGQLTGQNGIHSRYESSMINNYQSQIQYTGDSVAHIEDLNDYVFSFIYRNYEYVDSVLNADKTARTYAGSTSGSAYYQKLWENSKDFTLMLFKSASKILAELIYTAWKNAGSPGITKALDYYPLAEGNKWIYNGMYNNWVYPSYITVVREIAGNELKNNGKLYFKIIESGKFDNIYYERIDSLTEKIYRYDPDSTENNFEYLIEDLKAEPGDTIDSYRYKGDGLPFFESFVDTVLFNHSTKIRNYKSGELLNWDYSLAQNFGIIYVGSGDDNRFFDYQLAGAVIDGIVYGDTTLVGIEDEKNLPTEFSLYQNYPNPFNPTTKIKFTIPFMGEIVSLKIYDILGNVIATLVNEVKSAGEYEVEFDAGKYNLSSGVYFYKLSYGSYKSIRKAVLIK